MCCSQQFPWLVPARSVSTNDAAHLYRSEARVSAGAQVENLVEPAMPCTGDMVTASGLVVLRPR